MPLPSVRVGLGRGAARRSLGAVLTASLALGLLSGAPAAGAAGVPTAGLPAAVSAEVVVSPDRPAAGAGARSVSPYAVPAGAVFVATTGSDSSSGTAARPVRTLARALKLVSSGGAIVLRGGSYHESVEVGKAVTIQGYPGEKVWLDGSSAVGGWVKDGSVWRRDGWTTRFDASVGYRKGAKDGTSPGWKWLRDDYPMAAHPDQVWVGGKALRQVASAGQVRSGTFYLDESSSRLYIGSDPAAGVRASTLARAIAVRAPGTTIRGIGVRRYAPSIWTIGSLMVDAPRTRLRDVTVTDSATIGLGVTKADVVLDRVTVRNSGLLGIHAGTADRLLVRRSLVEKNNLEHFNHAPVSGGVKITRTQKATVRSSILRANDGPGIWVDESTYDARVVGSDVTGNAGHGVFLEISAKGLVADSVVARNGGDGIRVQNTSDVQLWNNTSVRNGRAVNLVQDSRRYATASTGQDPRHPGDPLMTWLLGPVKVRNSVLGLPTSSATCVLCVEDWTHQRTAAQIGVTSNGNVFNRTSGATTRWLTVWSRGSQAPDPYVYTTLTAHRSGTGQDGSSVTVEANTAVRTDQTLVGSVASLADSKAVSLPSSVASVAERPAGTRAFGAMTVLETAPPRTSGWLSVVQDSPRSRQRSGWFVTG